MEEESKGFLKRLVLERIERFIIELLIVILGWGEVLVFGWNILYGRFWIGNWEFGFMFMNDFIKDVIKLDE